MSLLDKIKTLRKEGKTYQEIGDILGHSKQRIHQIARKSGIVVKRDKKNEVLNNESELYQRRIKNADNLLFSLEVQTDFDLWVLISDYHRELRLEFIDFLKKNNLSNDQIAKSLQVSKKYLYLLHRYGVSGRLNKGEKKDILERDNYMCQNCKATDSVLHVHHVKDPRSKDPSNLITLCASCHKKEDTRIKHEKITISA